MPRGGGTAGGSKKSSGIHFMKPSEPSFIKRIKEQVGFKETVTIESKRLALDQEDDGEGSDREDEQPTVVVLKEGDLTAEQVAKEKMKTDEDKEEVPPPDGRIIFKKPSKKRENENEETEKETKEKKKKKEKKTGKSLLSFDEENEDE